MRYAIASLFTLLVAGMAGTVPDGMETTIGRLPTVLDAAGCADSRMTGVHPQDVEPGPVHVSVAIRDGLGVDMVRSTTPSAETVPDVTGTLHELVACMNAGNERRVMALHTGDGLRDASTVAGSHSATNPVGRPLRRPPLPRPGQTA